MSARWRWTLLLLVGLALTAPVHAASISIPNIQNNQTVSCLLQIDARATMQPGETYVGSTACVLQVTQQSTGQTILSGTMQFFGAETWRGWWNTEPSPNSNYTIKVTFNYRTAAGVPTTATASVNVVTRNGIRIVLGANTFARVNVPANGATFMLNQIYTVGTSHSWEFEKFSDCGTYTVSVRWRHYDTQVGSGVYTNGSVTMGPDPGTYIATATTGATWRAIRRGTYSILAFTEVPIGNAVASGSVSITVN
jgi:hypothetical protein